MKKILVVEDNKLIANAYRVKLTSASYDVRVVTDGELVLQTLKEYLPDLIILDLVIPNKDGFAVLRDIKESADYKKIPIIIATNVGLKEHIDKAKQMGSDDYVIKTELSMKKLIEKIKSIIGE